jgi:hypothetical protein
MTTKPQNKLISLTEHEYETPTPHDIYFKANLPGKELMIEPGTVATIISIGKFLYDTFLQAKQKKQDNVGEWIIAIDYKLDKILRELVDIKEELRKLEILINELPFREKEGELDAYIYTYLSNVFELRTGSIDLRRGLFEGEIYPNLTIRRKIIQDHSFAHLYKVVLAFIIEYEIIMVFHFTPYTKRLKLTELRDYLMRAKDVNVQGSYGQILQVHRNTLAKLVEDYLPISGQERREYAAKRKTIHYGPAEPKDFYELVSKIAYNYGITGSIDNGFQLNTNYIGEVDRNEVVSGKYSSLSGNLDETKNAILDVVRSRYASYQAKHELYQEIEKNVAHFESIVADIEKYLLVVDDLLADLSPGAPAQ